MNFRVSAITCILVTALISPGALSESIWLRSEVRHSGQGLIADDKASTIGDVLTVQIEEGSTIQTKKDRTLDKKGSGSSSGSGSFTFGDLLDGLDWFGFGRTFNLPSWDAKQSHTNKLEGKADWSSSEKYVDKITVLVEDIMPNGNLLVLGKRTREVAGNTQIIQASGIVRPSDINAENIIQSSRVANFHIVYITHGRENTYLRQGWLVRIWNLISPF